MPNQNNNEQPVAQTCQAKTDNKPPKEIFNAPYTYVETYDQLAEAVLVLSRSPYLVVDCEGYDVGQPGGKLSLLAIGTAQSCDLFVIDVLNIKDKEEVSVITLLALLTDETIPKFMWDGRGDYVEIIDWYGIQMKGIWDLQVAEVVSRALRHETESHRLGRIVHRTGCGWKAVRKNPGLFDDIHLIDGLGGIVSFHHIGENLAKDTEVVAMHRAGESGRWMERPLPDRLIQYAANDIYLIASVYTFFVEEKWIRPELPAQSARYINAEVTREHKLKRQQIGSFRFLPMGVLRDPSSGPVYVCSWCERSLDLESFQHKLVETELPLGQFPSQRGGKKKSKAGKSRAVTALSLWRKPCCRVCVVSAMKSGIKINNTWIAE